MPIFKRILKYDQKAIAQREKRLASRFKISPNSPLRVSITFGHQDFHGRVINLSSMGVAILVPAELPCENNTACRIEFTLDNCRLNLGATVTNHEISSEGVRFGFKLDLINIDTRLSYLQLIEPLHIGATLAPGKRRSTIANEYHLNSERYISTLGNVLTIWRDVAENTVTGFEFWLADYCVRNGKQPPDLSIFTADENNQDDEMAYYDAPTLTRTSKENLEIRKLFRWTIPHLSKDVPDDVKQFLMKYLPTS